MLTAFLDASALYPAPLRDLLLELAVGDHFRAKWSEAVHDEWIAALLRTRGDLTRERLERTRRLMNTHVRDAVVTGFEPLVHKLQLPDPNDRHVLAAAIKGGAAMIVTANLKDFPAPTLDRLGLEAVHPDRFLTYLHVERPDDFRTAARTVRNRLKNPPLAAPDYLKALRGCGLLETSEVLAPFADDL